MMKPTLHTAVISALDSAKTPHKIWHHADSPSPIASPRDFATWANVDIQIVTKTLFLELGTDKKSFALVVAPSPSKLNFEAVASHFSTKKVQLASRENLRALLDYPPNGVSPIGCGDYPIALEASILNIEKVFIGGGAAGLEIEIRVDDLVKLVSPSIAKIVLET